MIPIKEKTTSHGIGNTITAILILFIIIFCSNPCPVLAQYKTGSLAPEFSLQALDGEVYQLNQFLNKQQHLIIFFINSEDSPSITKLEEVINFLNDYQPKESLQIIVIAQPDTDNEPMIDRLDFLKDNTELPLINLLDNEGKVKNDYGIKNYPTILLLRPDLYVRKDFDRFTTRQEASFYQYLKFIFTSRKSRDTSNGCDNGLCPPPPGFE